MIEGVATPLASATLVTRSTAEADRHRPTGPQQEPAGPADSVEVRLPAFLYEEISQVAHSEECEISDIVVNALDQYLADHWVRS